MQRTTKGEPGRAAAGLRRSPRAAVALAAGLMLLAPAACSSTSGGGDHDQGSTSQLPKVRTTESPVTVVGGATPEAVSLSVSRALFDSSPTVVVADAADGSALDKASAAAGRLAAPLLLAGSGSVLSSGLSGELTRLHPSTVVTTSSTLAEPLKRLHGIHVVTDASSRSAVRAPATRPQLTVLLHTNASASSRAVAAAGVKAAGARLLTVPSNDLRHDPKAIAALADQKPQRVVAVGNAFGPVDRLTQRVALAETGTQLIGGGQAMFPGRRLVALYGHPGTPGLGVLGEQGLTASIARAKKIASSYDKLSDQPVVPTFEIIATTASGAAGGDGDYSNEASIAELKPWVEGANAAGVYVVLDLQPGRANFLAQAKLYTELLRMPNVGLALDPEWRLRPDQRPLQQIGGADAQEINSVTSWLADLTAKEKLPQKLLVLHQFRLSMIRDEEHLKLDGDEVQVLIHMDGQGSPDLKDATWASVTHAAPKGVPFGWKNFYDEDHPMLTPEQTMTKKPTPMMISYQ